jgi:choice-of-anchor B domain-containing protein
MRYILLDDELDELDGTTEDTHTTTYIFDVGDLTKPKYTGKYKSPAYSIDHNQYVVLEKGLSFQSNYGSGLRIVDVSSVSRDPTAKGFKQAGFFDCDPSDDGQTAVAFQGSWSVYPWFESGYILLNSIERGLFLLRYTG